MKNERYNTAVCVAGIVGTIVLDIILVLSGSYLIMHGHPNLGTFLICLILISGYTVKNRVNVKEDKPNA